MRHSAIFSWWQNALLAIALVIAVPVGVGLLASDRLRPHRLDVAVAFAVIWGAVCVTLAVRAARQGVYARPAHLELRSILRTRVVPYENVSEIRVYEAVSLRGGHYFAPAVDYQVLEPSESRSLPGLAQQAGHTVNLWWLATVGEDGASRYADRIRALMASAVDDDDATAEKRR